MRSVDTPRGMSYDVYMNNNKVVGCTDCDEQCCSLHSRTTINLSELHELIMTLRDTFNLDKIDAACNELHQMDEFTVVTDDTDSKPDANSAMIAKLALIQSMIHDLDCEFHDVYDCR